MFKVVVTGSRDWDNWQDVEEVMRELTNRHGSNVELHHGTARGADRMCAHVARKRGFTIIEHPADWERYGKRAGIVRNGQMLDCEPDLVVGFWLDESPGTGHLLKLAQELGYEPIVYRRYTQAPKKKGTKMSTLPNINPEQLATIVASVMAALTEAPQTAVYDETDIEGNPLKTEGHGVREVKQFASCKNCGTGNVAWVQSTKSFYPQDHPDVRKRGQGKWYLAQAYRTSSDKLIALAHQRHSAFCQGTDAPVTTTQDTPTSPEVGEPETNNLDDALEAQRQEEQPFDATSNSEVDEAGDDLPMGLLLDLDRISHYTVGARKTIAQRLWEAADAIDASARDDEPEA